MIPKRATPTNIMTVVTGLLIEKSGSPIIYIPCVIPAKAGIYKLCGFPLARE